MLTPCGFVALFFSFPQMVDMSQKLRCLGRGKPVSESYIRSLTTSSKGVVLRDALLGALMCIGPAAAGTEGAAAGTS